MCIRGLPVTWEILLFGRDQLSVETNIIFVFLKYIQTPDALLFVHKQHLN